jgi:hypothetical protein
VVKKIKHGVVYYIIVLRTFIGLLYHWGISNPKLGCENPNFLSKPIQIQFWEAFLPHELDSPDPS